MTSRDDRARIARLRAAEQDHFERTRHSFMLEGRELGYVKPTRETEAKLKADPIARLVQNETLTRERGRAAIEIREIIEATMAGMLARAADFRTSGGRPQIPERIAMMHAQHYRPWAVYLAGQPEHPALQRATQEIAAAPAQTGRCPPALELTIDVVFDGRSLIDCERARGWRKHGMAAKLLTYALAVYADQRGWERNRAEMAAFEAWWGRRAGRASRGGDQARSR
jgi:histone H3/H4